MVWYWVFAAFFLVYQVDVYFYSAVAVVAALLERLRPVPGHPSYDRRHPSPLVRPPRAAAGGGGAGGLPGKYAAASASSGSVVHQSVSWTIATLNATLASGSGSDEGGSGSGCASALGSEAPGSAAGSDEGAHGAHSGSLADDEAARGQQQQQQHHNNQQQQQQHVYSQKHKDQEQQQQHSRHDQVRDYHQQQQQQQQQPLEHQGAVLTALTGGTLRVRARGSSSGDLTATDGCGGSTPCASPGPGSLAGSPAPRSRKTLAAVAAANKALAALGRGGGGGGLEQQQHHHHSSSSSSNGSSPAAPTKPAAISAGGAAAAAAAADGCTLLPASLVDRYERLPGGYPLVLVQLPMHNEEAHCEVVIERACAMEWPRDRVIVQVCDDSTRDDIKARIDAKVAAMAAAGHTALVVRRPSNVGYKAGNMLHGLRQLAAVPWEYVAVFDADFEMPPDYLYQTIWHMAEDPKLAFVQARWSFANAYDNLLTWAQKVSLHYHFAVEQRARSFLGTFFGFNGTAGVWRRAAMEAAGGWSVDSTVEDMDLSVRAYLLGWKFRYLDWVRCPNELPASFSAYKTQQFRWNSGPMVIVKKTLPRIWGAAQVSVAGRLSVAYFFFRFIYSAFLTTACLLCPAVVIWLDPWRWAPANITFLVAGSAAAAAYFAWAGLLFAPYFLFQTGVGYFRVYAMASGLRGSAKSKSWKVTKKFGRAGAAGRAAAHKPYLLEGLLALYYAGMTAAACWYQLWLLASFTWIMAFTFAALAFGDRVF